MHVHPPALCASTLHLLQPAAFAQHIACVHTVGARLLRRPAELGGMRKPT